MPPPSEVSRPESVIETGWIRGSNEGLAAGKGNPSIKPSGWNPPGPMVFRPVPQVGYRDGVSCPTAFIFHDHLARPCPDELAGPEAVLNVLRTGIPSCSIPQPLGPDPTPFDSSKPHEVLHAFGNKGLGAQRFLEIISPAGFEQLFREGANLVSPKECRRRIPSERSSINTVSRWTSVRGPP